MIPASPQERATLAGEYVMGTLSEQERVQFETALATDEALQAEVYHWQDKLLGLALSVAPIEPEPTLWTRIEATLPARRDPIRQPARAPAGDPLRWLRLWQFVAAGSTAAAIVLAAVLLLRVLPQDAAPRYVTVLQAEDKSTAWLIEVTADDKLRLVPIGPPITVPAGKSLQFWTKLDRDAGPTSLGLVTPGRPVEIALDKLPGLEANQLFELTLEPEAGSPIGRPTGPILFIGRSVRL